MPDPPPENTARRNVFVQIGTDQGTMIVNRLDYGIRPDGKRYGVGQSLLESGGEWGEHRRPQPALAGISR